MKIAKLKNIHDAEFENDIYNLTNKDISELAKKKKHFVYSKCPACQNNSTELEYELYGLTYYRCNSCSTIYLNPCPTEDLIVWYLNNSKALKKWREDMPKSIIASRKKILYKNRIDYLIEQINEFSVKPRRMIDVGGGSGEFIEEIYLRKIFNKIIVVEPQELDILYPGVEVVKTTFESFKPKEKVDAIVAFEVLEHIINPDLFLSKVKECLTKNGIFIFSTPNIDGFETKTLGRTSRAYWFDHIRLYNTRSLRTLVERNGFITLKLETPGELDIQIVKDNYDNGSLELDNNYSLKFILDNFNTYGKKFQNYLIRNMFSSHMRCVIRKLG